MSILFHAVVLAGINLGSILMAFVVYSLLQQPGSQVLIQGGLAAVASIAMYAALTWLLEKAGMVNWLMKDKHAYLMAYLLAFFAFAIIFVPLHYVTQGYLTGVENILVSWAFMAPVNALALWAAWRLRV